MENKYLILSDLDGTLLNSNHQLSQHTINYIKELSKDPNKIFCIATGRPLRGAIDIYNKLGLNTIMLNYNGAFISNPSDLDFKPITLTFNNKIIQKILSNEKILSCISNAIIEGNNIAYCLWPDKLKLTNDTLKTFFHIGLESELKSLNGDISQIQHDVCSVLLHVNNEPHVVDKLIYWIKDICPTLVVRQWSVPVLGLVIEINSIFANKGMGLEYLSSYYGVSKDNILAFGDGFNDMDMLKLAKYGIAMKNANDAAKIVSYHITKYSNDEDGVVWELEYFFKNKFIH